jgi:HK97 family phage major capsid protein
LNAYKYSSGPILVSSELLQDSAFDIEQILRDAMAMRIGRKVNLDLTTGDGDGDPDGIVPAAGAGVTGAAQAAVTLDEMLDLVHSIDPAYRTDPSVGFMFNDKTLKALRKLKDGDGNYIWQAANVQTGAPNSLLGYRYNINQACADVGTSAKSILFGAMNRYIVRRVREFAVKRLVERYADYDQVGFIGFARYDGDLMDTAAVKYYIGHS